MQRLAHTLPALIWAAIVIALFLGTPSPDLTALYVAGATVSQGIPEAVYATPPEVFSAEAPPVLAAVRSGLGLADLPSAPYLYPPLWAWLVAPLTKAVSHDAFVNAALVLHVAMLAAAIGLSWRIVRPHGLAFRHWMVLGFVILSLTAPAQQALLTNSPQITSLFAVLLAFERYRAGAFAMAGALLAVAAAITLAPLFLALIFVLERNGRAALAFAGMGGLLALSSLALAGAQPHFEFLALLGHIDNLTVLGATNFAPETVLFQLGSLLTGNDPSGWRMAQITTWPEPLWLSVLMGTLMLAALAALILMRPRLVPGTAVPVLVLGVSLATALFGPVSWAQLYLLPLLLMPTLFHLVSKETAWRWIIAVIAVQSLPAYMLWSELSTALCVTALAGVLTFLGLLALLALAVFRAVRFEPDIPLHFR